MMAVPAAAAPVPIVNTTTGALPYRDLYADTWVGVDALGREIPDAAAVGSHRFDKSVGMFYFLTFDHTAEGPYDNTKILKAHPEAISDIKNPAWGPLNASHYWGEPLFGYYTSDDEYVLRKHAQMLVNAGIDMVVFDNSNAVTYDRARNTLLRVWEKVRQEGGMTPQIAFLCPFGNPGNMGSNTLASLYDSVYASGRYADLWFLWKGKPLILADPSYANAEGMNQVAMRYPARLESDGSLGQTFTVDRPFLAAGGEFPTWSTKGSGMMLTLRAGGPKGRILVTRKVANVADNATVYATSNTPLPAGTYYLEISRSVGQVGWWSYSGEVIPKGTAYEQGDPAAGDRSLIVRYVGGAEPVSLVQTPLTLSRTEAEKRAKAIRNFFTFRSPIAPYNIQEPPADHWAWLQVYPQAPQRDAAGNVEQVTAGVAQNYNATVNNTAPMSVPGAFGRSYHDGKLDTSPDAELRGLNFDEQWRRAREIDPPFIFITGWNEWTAGFYDSWVSWHAPPPIFVDQFNQEFSRDIEPMAGGSGSHGDNYYYQLVDNVRRYKGAQTLPPVTPRPIAIDGRFADWAHVQPEFRDALGDPAHRNQVGVGSAGRYVNASGRNDIITAKVSYDQHNVYFYVRTRDKVTPENGGDWMRLYLNTDSNYKTGWLGYDFAINGHPDAKATSIERNVGGRYQWKPTGQVRVAVHRNEIEIAVPISMLGAKAPPGHIDFKWADHCYAHGDWTDFTLNGDAAPDDRFNYRAKLR